MPASATFRLAEGVHEVAITLADGTTVTSEHWNDTYSTNDPLKIDALRGHAGVVEVPADESGHAGRGKKE